MDVAGGASVKTAQELARHSTPVLTIGRYSHARLHDLTGALDSLPKVASGSEPQIAELHATETDDKSPAFAREQLGGKTLHIVASGDETKASPEKENARRKVLPWKTLGERRRESAKVVRAGIEPATHGFSVHCSTN